MGGDFRLYRTDFEWSRPDGSVEDVADPHPRPLIWQSVIPGAGDVQFRDVAWPDETWLGGRFLASLRFKDGDTKRFTDWQAWWLQLGRGGISIVAADRLLEAGHTGESVVPRMPNLVRLDGEPALAYLLQRPGEPGYQLRVAPIRFDPQTGFPRAIDADSWLLAEGCAPTRPTVSPDGRWIAVVRASGQDLTVERIATPSGEKSIASETPQPAAIARFDGRRASVTGASGDDSQTSPTPGAVRSASSSDEPEVMIRRYRNGS